MAHKNKSYASRLMNLFVCLISYIFFCDKLTNNIFNYDFLDKRTDKYEATRDPISVETYSVVAKNLFFNSC